jgi:hypothetical protein
MEVCPAFKNAVEHEFYCASRCLGPDPATLPNDAFFLIWALRVLWLAALKLAWLMALPLLHTWAHKAQLIYVRAPRQAGF